MPTSPPPGRHKRRRDPVLRTPAVRRALSLPPVAVGLLAGSALLGPLPSATAEEGWRTSDAADVGLNQLGDPYSYGGNGPDSFDCSGLIQYSFRKAGFEHMPRTSSAQADRARRISKDDLQRGDLMFFTDGGGVYHAAIFLHWQDGHAVMLHSPEEGEDVQRGRPWTTSWFAATMRG